MTVKLLTFLLKDKLFASANQEVADYQSSLVQISRLRITAMTSNVHDIEFGPIWTTLDYAMFCQNTRVDKISQRN